VIFTILFAALNGLSVYLTIPLLDTLFQESVKKESVEQTSTIEKAGSILPDWAVNIGDEISNSFNNFPEISPSLPISLSFNFTISEFTV
jgi:hypothetical protein